MIVHVLGTGPSLRYFLRTEKYHSDLTIGVNTIWKQYSVDCLLVMDNVERFKEYGDYGKTIIARPYIFYSLYPDWSFMPNFQKIEIDCLKDENGKMFFPLEFYGDLSNLDHAFKFPFTATSVFTACCIAYREWKAKKIIVWGCDLFSHPELSGPISINGFIIKNTIDWIFNQFKDLKIELKKRGVELRMQKYICDSMNHHYDLEHLGKCSYCDEIKR